MDADLLPRRAGLTPEKITREHQQRLAIIYIRQSTPQQVERNQESTKLQYALVDRAFHFGWARETIVTIDDDLGRSGSTVEGRLGFQRLVAEVGLGHVGLVLGIEMSRLARSCRDWHQLLEIWSRRRCGVSVSQRVCEGGRPMTRSKPAPDFAKRYVAQNRRLAGFCQPIRGICYGISRKPSRT